MSELFLGVDGGQSSTTAVIGDASGRIVGWGSAGPCNHVGAHEGRSKFLRVISECLSEAALRAGIDSSRPHFRAACFGMSGGPQDKAALLGQLLEADHLVVTHDALIALSGAMAGGPGLIVIAGTGSISFGRNQQGETARAGGWGYIFGDEGGGFDIVRQSLRAILREHEGWGPRTALTPALLEAAGAAEANNLLHRFYTAEWPRSRVAELAKLVNRIAEEGDPIAREILETAAQQLAMLSASVRRQLWKEGDPVEVSYIGGVFRSPILHNRFQRLIECIDHVTCHAPLHSPAIGALFEAYRAAGLAVKIGSTPPMKT